MHVPSSHTAMVDFKSRCETAVQASIETVSGVDKLLCEARSGLTASLYPAMLSIRNILIAMDEENQSYASSLQYLIRELNNIKHTASADDLQSITAIENLVARESSLVARLFRLTTYAWVIVSQYIAFLNEQAETLRITDQRIDSASTPVRTGILFYEKKIAVACDALRNLHESSGV